MAQPELVEKVDPDEVFGVLANDTRIAILQALWEADGYRATFSELRDRVGMRDSGQFSYHLDKLVDLFVGKSEDDYALTQAGKQVIGAIEAGAYTTTATIEPINLSNPCPTCGGDRTLSYADQTIQIKCDSCPVGYQFGVPPAAFGGYERAAIPLVASRYLRTMIRYVDNGFCVFCDGRTMPTVGPITEIMPDPETREEVPDTLADQAAGVPFVQYTCEQCGATPTAELNLVLVEHPAVAGFFFDHGIDVQEELVWDLASFDPAKQSIRSQDPFRAELTYEVDDGSLTVVVDDELEVVDFTA